MILSYVWIPILFAAPGPLTITCQSPLNIICIAHLSVRQSGNSTSYDPLSFLCMLCVLDSDSSYLFILLWSNRNRYHCLVKWFVYMFFQVKLKSFCQILYFLFLIVGPIHFFGPFQLNFLCPLILIVIVI